MENLYEKELLGKHDSENYSIVGWCISSIFLGIFAILFVYCINILPNSIHYTTLNSNLERKAYFQGYSKGVKSKRLIGILIGIILHFTVLYMWSEYQQIFYY